MTKVGGTAKIIYKLVSSAGTGFFYTGEKTTKWKYIYLDKLQEN